MSMEGNLSQVFEQIVLTLKQDIENELFHENEKLPTVLELSDRYQVSYDVMKAVLKQLEKEGILTRRAGVGTFVNAQPIFSSGIEQLGSVTKMIRHAGKTPGTQYVSAEVVEPSTEDFHYFHKEQLGNMAKIERIRTADGDPVVYCIDRVEQQYMPMEKIHNNHSIFQLLEDYSQKRISYAVTFIEPISYDQDISPILHCQPDQALLLLKQIHYTDKDEPILLSENYFRPDVFRFYVVRKRM